MTTSAARRQSPRGKAAGAGLLATDRPKLAVPVRQVLAASTEPAPEPEDLEPEDQEEVYEEVVVEPDLPVDASLPAALSARRAYDALVATMDPAEPVYVACNRAPRLKVGDYTLAPGEVVPGAHSWPRREAYERLGRIERR